MGEKNRMGIEINVIEAIDDKSEKEYEKDLPVSPVLLRGTSPSNKIELDIPKETDRQRYSAVLKDIETRNTEIEEKTLQDALGKLKQVKSSSFFETIVITFGLHLCVYVVDIITDFLNGWHYWNTGKSNIF